GRWLWHQNRTIYSDVDFSNANSDGCFVFDTDTWRRINSTMFGWGLRQGYDIWTKLSGMSRR
ncbi:MAG: hypothetical protein AB1798_19000, partial [Spirochaetota bacterium]